MDRLGNLLNVLKGGDEQSNAVKSTETGHEASSAPVDGSSGTEGDSSSLGESNDAKVPQSTVNIPSDGEKAMLMNESRQDTPLETEERQDENAEITGKTAAAGPGSEKYEQQSLNHKGEAAPVETKQLNSGEVETMEGENFVRPHEGDDTSKAHSVTDGPQGVQDGVDGIFKSRDADIRSGEEGAEGEENDKKSVEVTPDAEKTDRDVEVGKVEKTEKPEEEKERKEKKEKKEKPEGEKKEKKEKSEEEKKEKKEKKEKSEEEKKEKKEKKDKKEKSEEEKKEKKDKKDKKEKAEAGKSEGVEKGEEQNEKKEKKVKKEKKSKSLLSDKLRLKLDKLNGKIERILSKRDDKVLQLKEALEKERQEKERREQDRQNSENSAAAAPQGTSPNKNFPPPTYERTSSGLRREDTVLPDELRYHLEGEQYRATQKRMDRKSSGSLSRTATLYPSQLNGEDQMGLGDLPGSQLKDGCEDLPISSRTEEHDHDQIEKDIETDGEVATEEGSEGSQKDNGGSDKHQDPHWDTRLQPEMAAV